MKFYRDTEGNIYYKGRDGHTDVLFSYKNNEYYCEYDSLEADEMEELTTMYIGRYTENIFVEKVPCEVNQGNTITVWFPNGFSQMPKDKLANAKAYHDEYRSMSYTGSKQGIIRMVKAKSDKYKEKAQTMSDRIREFLEAELI